MKCSGFEDLVDGWLSCCSNHILGYIYKDDYLVNQYSSLMVKFPTGETKKLTERHLEDQLRAIKEEEQHYHNERIKRISKLKCDICSINSFISADDFLNHVNKNKIHKENITEFIEEDYEEDI